MINEIEANVLAQISLDEPWDLVEKFSTLPRWMPDDVNRGADEIISRLRRLGIPVEVYEPEIYLSVPKSAGVETSAGILNAKAPSMSLAIPDGRTGEVVYIGANMKNLRNYSRNIADVFATDGAADDLATKLKGRFLLTEGFGNPALTAIDEEFGAAGLIVINPGERIHWGTCTTIWGTPDLDDLPRKPTIPVVAVNNPDGAVLIKCAANGEQITVRSDLDEGWYKQKIPVVQITGKQQPEKFVLVHGHYDSWDVGVGDNATGDATMLELARVLFAKRDHLHRSVRIAWWPGHSTGRYAGSTWYCDTFAQDFEDNCVAQINCDSPGCRWATSYHKTICMAEMQAFVGEVITEIAGTAPKFMRPKQAGDNSFYNIGLPTYFSLTSTMPDELRAQKGYYEVSGCGGNIAWHTEDDILEIADREVLETDIKIYLLSVFRHAAAPILPVDWRATAEEFDATIADYQARAGDLFDLSPARDALADLSALLVAFYDGIAAGQITGQTANDVITRLGRILIPINFTLEARFRHDPAVICPPLPTLLPAAELAGHDPATLGFAKTQAMRGQNRFVAATRAACTLVEGAVK
jgi:N-acetylated-alpha-linked acidic dipeptidase